jgi:RNA polymerase sigma factor (sigma-70 family)
VERTVRDITAAIASGDTEAFSAWYRANFDWMHAHARRCTGRDESFCLDVVQDAMLKVIRCMRPFDDEASLRAWLSAIVRRCALDRLRAEARRARRERRNAAQEPTDVSLAHAIASDEQVEWLGRKLQGLESEASGLLALRYRLGLTLQQIGSLMGLKPGAVDGRINRLLSALRQSAAEEFHE